MWVRRGAAVERQQRPATRRVRRAPFSRLQAQATSLANACVLMSIFSQKEVTERTNSKQIRKGHMDDNGKARPMTPKRGGNIREKRSRHLRKDVEIRIVDTSREHVGGASVLNFEPNTRWDGEARRTPDGEDMHTRWNSTRKKERSHDCDL